MTMEPLVKQRKRPRSSGRPFSPIQTGAITKTRPKPIATRCLAWLEKQGVWASSHH